MNQMHLKSTIKTQKRGGGRCFGDYIANFDLTQHINEPFLWANTFSKSK